MGLFDDVFICPHCGASCTSAHEAATHCDQYTHSDWSSSGTECPYCNGSGVEYDFFGHASTCSHCGGRGTY